MDILTTAIAYRHDFEPRERWGNRKDKSVPVGCPKGCSVEYDLIVSVLADEQEIAKWINTLHAAMERSCPEHVDAFRF
jgi:hypothetical protein